MDSQITPDSRIWVASGTGLLSREHFAEMLRAVIPPGMVISTRDLGRVIRSNRAPEVIETPTEIEIWNAAVDKRKSEKKAGKP